MRKNGFTLMELLVVVALIMILSAVGIGTYSSSTTKSRDAQRKSDLNQMVKAIESFNNDIGRYPVSNTNKLPYCYTMNSGSGSDTDCVSNKLTFRLDGVTTTYITFPTDPDPAQKYIYDSDGSTFALYAALQNEGDKDLLTDEGGNIIEDPYGITCGDVPCNYKITENGLSKEAN